MYIYDRTLSDISEEIPKNICLKEVLIERMFCYQESYSLNSPLDIAEPKWVYRVAIIQDVYDTHYSLVLSNPNFFWEYNYDDLIYIEKNLNKISNQTAKDLFSKLKPLGKENESIEIPTFSIWMNVFNKIIPCNFEYTPIIGARGFYNGYSDTITIGSNQSEAEIIFATIHEYTHYLLKSLNENRKQPITVMEYALDEHEIICDTVAMEILDYLIIPGRVDYFLRTLETHMPNSLSQVTEVENFVNNPTNLGKLFFQKSYFSVPPSEDAKKLIKNIQNQILTNIDEALDELSKNKNKFVVFKRNECYLLNKKENLALYEIITKYIIQNYIDCNMYKQ